MVMEANQHLDEKPETKTFDRLLEDIGYMCPLNLPEGAGPTSFLPQSLSEREIEQIRRWKLRQGIGN